MESYAKLQGKTLTKAIKDAFFEKLEDEFDMQLVREYEREKEEGEVRFYTVGEVKRRLGLD